LTIGPWKHVRGAPRYTAQLLLIAAGCLSSLSCTYPVRNVAAETISPHTGYRWTQNQERASSDTLVIVTMSGGGSRAAALALSVLQGLDDVRLPNGHTLAQDIDIVSSVSGGSVTAGYFALKGSDGFDELENNFIKQDGIGAILWSGLNPIGLAKLSTAGTERIDLLIDYLDRQLFTRNQTFGTLETENRRPFLILNAADMVSEAPFAFTQSNFDLLCSDLSKLKLSTAVAASAAFPVLLSPVTLKDYSPCPAQKEPWPPVYVTTAADGTSWQNNPAVVTRGRVQEAYALGAKADPPTNYIHLLDGGTADNLGVSEPIDILTRLSPSPGLLEQLTDGHIRNIVFVMINARSFSTSDLNSKPDTPGALDMLSASLDSSIDNATMGAAERVRSVLNAKFADDAKVLRAVGKKAAAHNLDILKDRTHLIEIDFDAIEAPACRQNFHNIPTSWTLKKNQVDALLVVGKSLLGASSEFNDSLQALNAHPIHPLPSMQDACAIIAQKSD
jgi:NTE family protein